MRVYLLHYNSYYAHIMIKLKKKFIYYQSLFGKSSQKNVRNKETKRGKIIRQKSSLMGESILHSPLGSKECPSTLTLSNIFYQNLVTC